jgi:hypothetical protein
MTSRIMPTGIAMVYARTDRPVKAWDIEGIKYEFTLQVSQMQEGFCINNIYGLAAAKVKTPGCRSGPRKR